MLPYTKAVTEKKNYCSLLLNCHLSAVHTNAKPRLGAEQTGVNSHWEEKKISHFGKDSLSPFTLLLCDLYVSNNRQLKKKRVISPTTLLLIYAW